MQELRSSPEPDWERIRPVLDEALERLGPTDRDVLLLRFFEQRDFASVGKALGSNEDAARMRVKRALEKLHVLLKHRGVTMSVTALGTVLTTGAVTAAPAGLALATSSVALASLPGFTLPGDISASNRYYAVDLVDPPFTLNAGSTISVPTGPGLG